MSDDKPVTDQRAIFESGNVRIAVVVHRVGHNKRLPPTLAVVGRANGHDSPAFRPFLVRRRDVAIAGIEDAQEVARPGPAEIGKRGITARGLATDDDLMGPRRDGLERLADSRNDGY